jgi:hypothetical protein
MKDEERQQLIRDLRQYIAPDDIIMGMLFYCKRELLPYNVEKIHRSVYEVKRKYPQLLKDFSFSRNDVYPFSKLLERVLFNLCVSDLIKIGDSYLQIPPESKQYIQENVLPLFKEEQREQLKLMGELFEQNIE